jgi:hypothetical protein
LATLAILAGYQVEDLRRTGRSGEDLVFGRTTEQAFYASTIDYRARKAWKGRQRGGGRGGGRAVELPSADNAARVPAHLRLAAD